MIRFLAVVWQHRLSFFDWVKLRRSRDFSLFAVVVVVVFYLGVVAIDPLAGAMIWGSISLIGLTAFGALITSSEFRAKPVPRWKRLGLVVCLLGICAFCAGLFALLEGGYPPPRPKLWMLWSGVLTPVWVLGFAIELRAFLHERKWLHIREESS